MKGRVAAVLALIRHFSDCRSSSAGKRPSSPNCEALGIVKWGGGNGGQMALVRDARAAARKGRGTGPKKKQCNRGKSQLSELAGKALAANSKKIAKGLVVGAASGNASSAKLLLELTEEQERSEDGVHPRNRGITADMLAAEPEWEGDEIEGSAEEAC